MKARRIARVVGAFVGAGALGELWFVFTQRTVASAVIMMGVGAVCGSVWLGWVFSGNAPRS